MVATTMPTIVSFVIVSIVVFAIMAVVAIIPRIWCRDSLSKGKH